MNSILDAPRREYFGPRTRQTLKIARSLNIILSSPFIIPIRHNLEFVKHLVSSVPLMNNFGRFGICLGGSGVQSVQRIQELKLPIITIGP